MKKQEKMLELNRTSQISYYIAYTLTSFLITVFLYFLAKNCIEYQVVYFYFFNFGM
jgi:hypothetical protein